MAAPVGIVKTLRETMNEGSKISLGLACHRYSQSLEYQMEEMSQS